MSSPSASRQTFTSSFSDTLTRFAPSAETSTATTGEVPALPSVFWGASGRAGSQSRTVPSVLAAANQSERGSATSIAVSDPSPLPGNRAKIL